MKKVLTLKEIMKSAFTKRIVIPAFNVPYLPMVKPIAEVLKSLQTVGLIEVAYLETKKFAAQSYKAVKDEFEKYADREYVYLHQDHTPVIDEDGLRVDWMSLINEAIALGYDSVMIDGSRLPLDENIRVAREVVEIARKSEVPVEAELGAVLGHEAGPLPPYDEIFASGKGFTKVEEAVKFVRETGVDWLSVAIGNIHGSIQKAAKDIDKVAARLNVEHLAELRIAVDIPLVLHGGSGVRREDLLDAISEGITKLNIGFTIRQVYEKALQKSGDVEEGRRAVREKVAEIIKDYLSIEGSAKRLI